MGTTMNVATDQVQDWHHGHGMWIRSLGLGTDHGTGTVVVVAQTPLLNLICCTPLLTQSLILIKIEVKDEISS